MQDSRAETYKPLMKEVKEDLSSWECSRTQLAAHQLKDPMPRDRCWVNGKVALLRKRAALEKRGAHVPKNQLPSCQ